MALDRSIIESDLMFDEGFSGVPYEDTVGKVTIGYGRNLTDKPLTQAEGYQLLISDVSDAIHLLDQRMAFWRNLDPVRQSVLANMAYNLGSRLFTFRKMIAALQVPDYVTAVNEMLDSQWHQQVGARAERLAKRMATGRR